MATRGGDAEATRADREAIELGRALSERPNSLEAEQALLGALMCDSTLLSMMPDGVAPDIFFAGLHSSIFQSIQDQVQLGGAVDPVFIHEDLRFEPAMKELGGLRYLADMVDRAPANRVAIDHARLLVKLSMRREVVKTALDMAMAVVSSTSPPEDAVADADRRLTSLRLKSRVDQPVPIQDAVEGTLHYVKDDGRAVGVFTGLAPLDRQMGPMLPGDFIVLGGATGSGKSAVACAISQNVADPNLAAAMNGRDWDPTHHPRGVMKFDMEMSFGDLKSGGQVVRRHMADVGFHLYGKKFPTYAAIRAKDVSLDQYDMMVRVQDYLSGTPIVGLSRAGLTMGRMRHVAERQFMAWEREGIKPGLIVIDHLGLARVDKPNGNRYQEQTQIAIDGKTLGRDLGVPVLALAQIGRDRSKNQDDKRPIINDLKDSGELENSADFVLLSYRDAYYAKREKEPDIDRQPAEWGTWDARCRSKEVDIIMGKVREGDMGAIAKVWGEYPWNAIRGAEPPNAGDLL